MLRTARQRCGLNSSFLGIARWQTRNQHSASSLGPPPKTTFDRSMIRPFVWVVVFGSLVTHVIDRRQAYSDMEKRYSLKNTILKDLLKKVESGSTTVTEEQIEHELRLVNKMFVRDKSLGMKEVENVLSQMQISITKREEYDYDEEESLEDIWNGILEEANNDKPLKKSKREVTTPPSITTSTRVLNDIIVDKETLKQLRETEIEDSNDFSQNTDQHLIVENPGELSSSAKFL
ncbi:similar to Saccharomyces cerevisiae YIR024C Protein of unknown function [Maudiozyma barnettii]|uniref:Uncharacterized protein n=1 Tax=Maudiozyma barnettii TaxID=61262 RepID=A0A8H2ZM20_9SACH|nr:Ina22p [Kazachstania barnettii]CAB4256657.1 similar to Saccharomyces cerevisiae YIR024C Protein of unknown function [Kazachstania barnettii]CAD1785312.1 similar to Saccharomyces cerevisiae YIR024C Protein of unknown function [Kazachstania barnettii]